MCSIFRQLNTLRNKNAHKLLKSLMHLTSFVVTADGALGHEAKSFMRHLADKIAAIWHKSPSEVLGYVRARMLFAIYVLKICAFVAVE